MYISRSEILSLGATEYLGVRDNHVGVRDAMSDPEIVEKIFPMSLRGFGSSAYDVMESVA